VNNQRRSPFSLCPQAKAQGVQAQDLELARSLAGTEYSDLAFKRWAVQLGDCGFVATMEHKRLGAVYSVKVR
jgi:hypothetical protein